MWSMDHIVVSVHPCQLQRKNEEMCFAVCYCKGRDLRTPLDTETGRAMHYRARAAPPLTTVSVDHPTTSQRTLDIPVQRLEGADYHP